MKRFIEIASFSFRLIGMEAIVAIIGVVAICLLIQAITQ